MLGPAGGRHKKNSCACCDDRHTLVVQALKDAGIDPDDLNEMILVVSPGSTSAPADLVEQVNDKLDYLRKERKIPIKAVGLNYY